MKTPIQILLIPLALVSVVFAAPYWFIMRTGYGLRFTILMLFALTGVSKIHTYFEVEPSLETQSLYYYIFHYSRYTEGLLWLFLIFQALFLTMHWLYIVVFRKPAPHPWFMGTLPLPSTDASSGIANVCFMAIFVAVSVNYTVQGFSTPESLYHAATIFAVGLPALFMMFYIERLSEGIFPLSFIEANNTSRNRSQLCSHSASAKDSLKAIFSRRDKALKEMAKGN